MAVVFSEIHNAEEAASTKIMAIGIGGAGRNVIDSMITEGSTRV